MNKFGVIFCCVYLVSCSTLKRVEKRSPEYLNQTDNRLEYSIQATEWGEESDFLNKIGYFTMKIQVQNESAGYEPVGYELIHRGERKISKSELVAISKDPKYSSNSELWSHIVAELKERTVWESEISLLFKPTENFSKEKKTFHIQVNEQYGGPGGWSICNVTFQKQSKLYYKYAVK